MKIVILFALICFGFALNIQFGASQEKIMFSNRGIIYKIENFGILKYKLNISDYIQHGVVRNDDKKQIIDLCLEIRRNLNCEVIEALLTSFDNNTETVKNKRYIMKSLINNLRHNDKNTNQQATNKLQKDIKDNGNIKYNQTAILNETVHLQQNMTNKISSELLDIHKEIIDIKNNKIKEKQEHEFINFIQSIVFSTMDNAKIANSIIDLFFQPKPNDILNIISKERLLSEVKNAAKLLKSSQRFANSENLDMEKILIGSHISANKDNDGIGIEIKIPVVNVNAWKVFRVIPMIFREGGELCSIIDIKDYVAFNRFNDFTHFTNEEIDSCIKLGNQINACMFELRNDIDCERHILLYKNYSMCGVERSHETVRIMRMNTKTFIINTHENVKLHWGCNGVEDSYELSENAWIQLEHGCYLRILNQTFIIPITLQEKHLTVQMSRISISRGVMGPIYKLKLENSTLLIDEIQPQFKLISNDLIKNANDSMKDINKIYVPQSERDNDFVLYLMISGFISAIGMTAYYKLRTTIPFCNSAIVREQFSQY